MYQKTGKTGRNGPQNGFKNGRKGPWVSSNGAVLQPYKHYNYEIEAAVLGAIMLEKTAMARVRQALLPEMFWHLGHRQVFEHMCLMFDNGIFALDQLMVVQAMMQRKEAGEQFNSALESLPYFVTKLTMAVVNGAHLEAHAQVIRDLWVEREMFMITNSGTGDKTGAEVMAELKEKLTRLSEFQVKEDWVDMSVALVEMFQHIEKVRDQDFIGTPSGFDCLDRATGGLNGGDLIILAARPSVGKTAAALKMARTMCAGYDIPIGVMSLEMQRRSLAARIMSQAARIDFWKIYRGRLSDEEIQQLYVYAAASSGWPISFSDAPVVNMREIFAKAGKLIRAGKCKCLLVDYLQLVAADEDDKANREQQVSKISRGFKLLAMEYDIPVILLAQLNRESTKRANKRPELSDLRESGSVEQDADGVILLHRDWMSHIKTDPVTGESTEHEADFIVAKWRNGETFEQKIGYDGKRMEFYEDAPF